MSDKSFIDISIPDDLDNVIESGVKKALKHKRQIRIKASIVSIMSGIILVFTIGLFNPALADKIPIAKKVLSIIEKNVFFPGEYSKYSTAVDKKAFSNGISVTLSDVLCDGESLYVTYSINSSTPFENIKSYYNPNFDPHKDFPVDTTQLDIEHADGKFSFTSQKPSISGLAGLEGYFIDDNTYVGMEKYDLSSIKEKIPDQFAFMTKISYIPKAAGFPEKLQFVEGDWEFNVPVTVDRSLAKTIKIEDAEYAGIRIDSMVITPFEIKIKTSDAAGKSTQGLNYGIAIYRDDTFVVPGVRVDWSDPTYSVFTFKAPPKDYTSLVIKLSTIKYTPDSRSAKVEEALRKTITIN